MSFNPLGLGVAVQNYIGQTYSKPSKLGETILAQPRAIPLQFNWANYGVSNTNNVVVVGVNLKQNSQTALLDAVRGVYIDNTGSDASIYVVFPSTGCTVTCPPFAETWQPALCNDDVIYVVGQGFQTGDASQTNVFLSNIPFSAGTTPELNFTYPQFRASPKISRGLNIYSNGWNSPALGDQFQFASMTLGASNSVNLFGTPYNAGGFITLTDVELDITGINGNTGSPGITGTFSIASTGPSGTYFSGGLAIGGNVLNRTNLQHKLNAAETWQLSTTITSGGSANFQLAGLFGFNYFGTGTAETLSNFGTLAQNRTGLGVVGSAGTNYGGFQFTAPQTESILAISLLINTSVTGGNQNDYVASIYTDNAGHPGTLLATSKAIGPINNAQFVETRFTFSTLVPISINQKYWVVFGSNIDTLGWVGTTNAVVSNISGLSNTIAGIAGGQLGAGVNWNCQVYCQQP